MKKFPAIPILEETRLVLSSAETAPHLGLTTATLSDWSNDPNAPMRPLRYNRRKLMWKVSEIKRLLGVAA
jgi:hypothetical protein